MDLHFMLKAIGFILLIIIGIPGNLTILTLFAYIRISSKKLLPVDLIIINLAFVNLITILVESIPQLLTALEFHRLFNNEGCADSFNAEYILDLEYCVIIFPNYLYFMTIGSIRIFRDFLFLMIMVAASSFIVAILYQHNQKIKHMLQPTRTQNNSTEGRVAKGVVTMVVLYIFFYGVDNIFWVYTLCSASIHPEISDHYEAFFLLIGSGIF
ncbi:olfactory receptor class A-like protein 1 [Protopterus annectens]|uniref:olfactory receptor class A-like protein 1 n=1 Tax=Protopterus annectens TaxID=7888 RepID=UPI001CFA1F9A|nr:olfactory receptor class A-like protein 1 [Protopterus annectens]